MKTWFYISVNDSYLKTTGGFSSVVAPAETGRGWQWNVSVSEDPLDPGDSGVEKTKEAAMVACEEAMNLIVDEMFDDIVFQTERDN